MTLFWKKIDLELTKFLIEKFSPKNVNKTFSFNDKQYTLLYISKNSSKFFRSRSLSVYFKTGRSIIRLSDHWSHFEPKPKSQKMNCGFISKSNFWKLVSKATNWCSTWSCGKFPWDLYAGKISLAILNKKCDHFK